MGSIIGLAFYLYKQGGNYVLVVSSSKLPVQAYKIQQESLTAAQGYCVELHRYETPTTCSCCGAKLLLRSWAPWILRAAKNLEPRGHHSAHSFCIKGSYNLSQGHTAPSGTGVLSFMLEVHPVQHIPTIHPLALYMSSVTENQHRIGDLVGPILHIGSDPLTSRTVPLGNATTGG
jgi:hypothetical protein